MYQTFSNMVLLSENSESGTHLAPNLMSWHHSFKFSLRGDARYSGKRYPVRLVVNLPNSKRARISTGVKLLPKEWDEHKQRARGSSAFANYANNLLDAIRLKTINILADYNLREVKPTPELFTNDFKSTAATGSFLEFARKELEAERPDIAHSTYKKIKGSLNVLELFKADLAFIDINENLLIEYERFLKRRGNNTNARAKNMSQLRKYVNVALRKKYLRENPFENFKVKIGVSDREALTPEHVTRLIKMYFNEFTHPTHKEVLQYFLASVFTGLRYSDIAKVNRSNIVERSLVFTPQKTAHLFKVCRIPLPEVFFEIIDEQGPLFKRVLSNQKTNDQLKAIQHIAGIPINLSFHIARHTFACLYLYFGGKVEELRVLMGHSDIKTTMVYVHITDAWTQKGMQNFDIYFGKNFNTKQL